MTPTGALFSDLISSISERGRSLIGRKGALDGQAPPAADLVSQCEQLLSGRGEASGTALARMIIDRYQALDQSGRHAFFHALLDRFGPDQKKLVALAQAWLADPSDAAAGDLHFSSEPRRQELLRRLNRAPGGTGALVAMRADLVAAVKTDPALAPVDRDFAHLLSSWFNRGFLVLRSIDWSTPAIVLEKIIRYEAVHEIRDFPSLRLRIDPPDRRCYGFFHPALPDEPLIFVEVALTDAIPAAIAPLLAEDREPAELGKAKVAVFYSISNCQQGLAGISFGNFLIKQVVEELRRESAKIETFVTLSPAPGFGRWLEQEANLASLSVEDRQVLARLPSLDWHGEPGLSEKMRRLVEPLAAIYFLAAKRADGRPADPVAGFHLGNGARLERINWLGDRSEKGMRDAGLMVNYLYELDEIEKNHEAFANNAEVVASPAVRRLVKTEPKGRLEAGVVR